MSALTQHLREQFDNLEAALSEARERAEEAEWDEAQEELRDLEIGAARLAHALEEEKQ